MNTATRTNPAAAPAERLLAALDGLEMRSSRLAKVLCTRYRSEALAMWHLQEAFRQRMQASAGAAGAIEEQVMPLEGIASDVAALGDGKEMPELFRQTADELRRLVDEALVAARSSRAGLLT